MTKRHISSIASPWASPWASTGAAVRASIVAASLMVPLALGSVSAQAEETAGPEAVTVLVQYSALSGAYADDAARFTMPVYFGRDDTALTDDAQVALGALADETATYSTVSVTVRSNGDDDQAVAVYDTLYEYGVPARVMALDLEDDRSADVVASAI